MFHSSLPRPELSSLELTAVSDVIKTGQLFERRRRDSQLSKRICLGGSPWSGWAELGVAPAKRRAGDWHSLIGTA